MVKEGMMNDVTKCEYESWSVVGTGGGTIFVPVVTNGVGKGKIGCADKGRGGSSRLSK